jgi:antitoxin (DNA-binding transcriptional repressor) of toxin-antitoxin stability system
MSWLTTSSEILSRSSIGWSTAKLVVTEQDRPIAEIRPIESVRKPRPFGLAKGTFVVPDDFDAPLPEDVLKDFE